MTGPDDPRSDEGGAPPVEHPTGDEPGAGAGDEAVDLTTQPDARDRMPGWVPRAILLGFVAYLGIGVLRWTFGRLSELLVMLLVALFVSFALEPAVNILERRGWRRGVATACVFFGALLAFAGFSGVIGKVVADEAVQLIEAGPDLVEDLAGWANETFGTELDAKQLREDLVKEDGPVQRAADGLADNALSLSTTVLGVVFQLLTIGLFSFYFVVDGPRLRRVICSGLPPDRQRQVLETWELAIAKTGGYLYSRALLAMVSAAFHWVAFTAIGLKYAPVLALFVGVISQFVPVIGTYIAGAMPAVVALANDPLDAVWVVAIVVVYQQIENYLLAPRITASTMEMHPAVAFGAVIAGGSLLGTPGVLLGLPAAAVAQAIASSSLARHEVVDSELTNIKVRKPTERSSLLLKVLRRRR